MILRETLASNIGMKMLSILVAVFLWLFVYLGKDATLSLRLPVEINNLRPGLSTKNGPLPEVVIRVTGSRFQLLQLDKKRLQVVLDLTGVGEGTVTFPVLELLVKIPTGMHILSVYPSALMLNIGSIPPG